MRIVLAKVFSCAVIGLDGELVEVEVDINRGSLPTTTIVGLPDTAVQESKERVRSAIKNSALTTSHVQGDVASSPRVSHDGSRATPGCDSRLRTRAALRV